MEWLSLVAIIGIIFSNLYIGIHVRNQQITREEQFENARISAFHLEAALKNAFQELPQPKPPVVTVLAEPSDISFDIDYDKLSSAIKRALLESQVAIHNAKQPDIAVPYYPATNDNTLEDGHTNIVTIDGVQGKQFPAR